VADQDLELRFSIKSDEAVAGIENVKKSIEGVSDSLKPVTEATKQATTAFSGLGEAGDKVAAAEAKLEAGGDSPRKLIKAATEATLAVEALKKSLTDAGKPISPELEKALDGVKQKAIGAAAEAAHLGESLKNMRTAGAAASQNMDALKGSFGSVDGILQQLSVSGNSAMKSIGNFGKEMGGVTLAFETGFALGKKFDEQLKSIGIDLSRAFSGDIAGMMQGFVGKLRDTGIFGAKLTSIMTDMVKATTDYGNLLDPLPGKMNAHLKVMQAAALEYQKTAKALDDMGVHLKTFASEQATLTKTMGLMGDAAREAAQKGEPLQEWARVNVAELVKLRDQMEAEGKTLDMLDPKLRSAILIAQGMADAYAKHADAVKVLREANEQLNTSIVGILTTLQQELVAAQKSGNVWEAETVARKKATEALAAYGAAHGLTAAQIGEMIKKQMTLIEVTKVVTQDGINMQTAALDKMNVSLDAAAKSTETIEQAQKAYAAAVAASIIIIDKETAAWTANAKAINEADIAAQLAAQSMDKTGQTMERLAGGAKALQGGFATSTILMTELMHATQAQTDALERQIATFKNLKDTMGESTKALEDYAATMLDAWKSGTMSLIAWNQQMDIAITQLTVLIGKNAGTKFAEDMQKMAAALRELRDSVNTGGVQQTQKINI
jgi:hypothetical protein